MDTARFSDIYTGSNETIQHLAESGANFRNAISPAPWSLPSHASLFTGTHSSKHGAHATHKQLTGELTMLPEIFQQNGYETVAISNNTWISEEFGFGRGFDTFYKTWQYVQSDTDLGEIARTRQGIDQIRSLASRMTVGNPITNLVNTIYGKFFRRQHDEGAQQTTGWIIDWLHSRDNSQPFFLFANYLEPHLEYRPPVAFAEQFLPPGVSYEEAMGVPQNAWRYIAGKTDLSEQDFEILRALYRAELAYLDERIGELKRALEHVNKWKDTVLIVTGDHGENIGDHDLMDHQYCLYDTLLHVPLVIHGGSFTGQGTSDQLVQLTDLAPTLLDVANIDAPATRTQFQGVSFHPDSDTESQEYAIAEYMGPQPSIDALEKRVGPLPEYIHKYDRSLRAIRTTDYKLIRGSDGSRELYQIAEDPMEEHDLAEEQPEIRNDLDAQLDEWVDSFEHADTSGSVSMSQSTQDRLEDLGYLQ